MKNGSIREILNGDVLNYSWFRRQLKLIILVSVLIFVYIYAGYRAECQQSELAGLRKELQDAQFEQLTISAQLVERTRQSAIVSELKKRGSDVRESKMAVTRIQ